MKLKPGFLCHLDRNQIWPSLHLPGPARAYQ